MTLAHANSCFTADSGSEYQSAYGSRFSDLEHFDAFGYLDGRAGVVWR